jgi:hypothetical protein
MKKPVDELPDGERALALLSLRIALRNLAHYKAMLPHLTDQERVQLLAAVTELAVEITADQVRKSVVAAGLVH